MYYGHYDYYIAEYFGSVIFHVNYLSYLPVFLCLLHLISRLAGVGRRAAGDRRLLSSHNGVAVCWTTRSPVAVPGGAAHSERAFVCAGMLLPGGMMPMGAMFPSGMVMQPRYR